MAGVMPDRVRAIRTDDRYRLDVDALALTMENDRRQGLTPFAVVSNAGTTNTGAVDPLDRVADVCAREGLWHHVDGAYGAFFQLCDELRPALNGLSRADSLTLDPHKGMFLPYGTGALLVRDGAALRAAHEATAACTATFTAPHKRPRRIRIAFDLSGIGAVNVDCDRPPANDPYCRWLAANP
jgi:aromatic-L-amino-acid decarboxylase